MLYTGVSRADHGLVQRIGLAASDDLVHWSKDPANPVLEADPRWYELLGQGRYPHQAWRDPWLFRDGRDGLVHVLLTARSRRGAPDGAGVLGHAYSKDLVNWEVLPPLTEPGDFAQLEVPQLVQFNGSHTILFSCLAEDHSRRRRERLGPGRGNVRAVFHPVCGALRSKRRSCCGAGGWDGRPLCRQVAGGGRGMAVHGIPWGR